MLVELCNMYILQWSQQTKVKSGNMQDAVHNNLRVKNGVVLKCLAVSRKKGLSVAHSPNAISYIVW